MRICNLSSGSDGNVTYIESATTKILVDAGLSLSEIYKRLKLLNVDASQIDAILVTHEHSDHIRGLDGFVAKYNTKVYVHTCGMAAVLNKMKKCNNSYFYSFKDSVFTIGDLAIEGVCLSHDSEYCSGYTVCEGEKKISIITDLGYTNDAIISKIMGSTLVYLESNHDVEMLKANPKYSAWLKARILGKRGHLSNLQCAMAIEKLVYGGTKQIMLSHISTHNNTPQIAYTTACEYLESKGIIEGVNVKISVASVMPSAIFRIN